MMLEENADILKNFDDPNRYSCNFENEFWCMNYSCFLTKQSLHEILQEKQESKDSDMEFQDEKMDVEKDLHDSKSQKLSSKSSNKKPLPDKKDINFRKWHINLKDKLNLNKYTKTLHMGQSLLKQRMNEHKETFLPKPYAPFKFSNQQMYKIIKPEEPEKIMKEINISQSFEIDYVELLTKYEFPAVLRLKKKFMHWFCGYMHEKIQKKKQDIEEKRLIKEEEERLKCMKEESELKNKKDKVKIEPVEKKTVNFGALPDIDDIDPLEPNPSEVLH
jgi:hypothetical protein